MIQAVQTIDAHGAPVVERYAEYELEDIAVVRQEPYVWWVKLRQFSNPSVVLVKEITTWSDRYDVFISALRSKYPQDWGLVDWGIKSEPRVGTTEWEF